MRLFLNLHVASKNQVSSSGKFNLLMVLKAEYNWLDVLPLLTCIARAIAASLGTLERLGGKLRFAFQLA